MQKGNVVELELRGTHKLLVKVNSASLFRKVVQGYTRLYPVWEVISKSYL
jgi:hypothetical protein